MKLYLLTAATVIALGFGIPANAQDEATMIDVNVAPAPAAASPVASTDLANAFATICNSTAVLSDKAQLACINNAMPKVAKSAVSFRNTGIGAEFNTLIRNATAFSVAQGN